MADLLTDLSALTSGFAAVVRWGDAIVAKAPGYLATFKSLTEAAQQAAQANAAVVASKPAAGAGQATGTSYQTGERSNLEELGSEFSAAYGPNSYVAQLITDSFSKADAGNLTLQQAIDEIRGLLSTYQVGRYTLTDPMASVRDRQLATILTAFENGAFPSTLVQTASGMAATGGF